MRGPMEIPLQGPRVSVIGTRNPSEEGTENARIVTEALVKNGITILSGLAAGIDATAHGTAIEMGGKTIAVLGTPLDKTYPRQNYGLQREIMENHLAISQFPTGRPVTRGNFVIRNRTMALISNASIIIEGGNASGSLHQGWETVRLGRSLFILSSTVRDPALDWPRQMIRYGAMEISDPSEILEFLPSGMRIEMPPHWVKC